MTPRSLPRLAVLKTLPQLAREVGRPRSTFFRQMKNLHEADEKKGDGGWLIRRGLRWWEVNVSLLRARHPGLFEHRWFSRDEADAVLERLEAVEAKQAEDRKQRMAVAGRVRDLTQMVLPLVGKERA